MAEGEEKQKSKKKASGKKMSTKKKRSPSRPTIVKHFSPGGGVQTGKKNPGARKPEEAPQPRERHSC